MARLFAYLSEKAIQIEAYLVGDLQERAVCIALGDQWYEDISGKSRCVGRFYVSERARSGFFEYSLQNACPVSKECVQRSRIRQE